MQPIDIVYCWCDGNDPAFKARKNLYLREEKNEHDEESIGNHRFVDNEELKYSLRSLEMYAPWINHVYIVTDRQIPKWLNCSNERVSIIDHSEIMPKDIIPCFNATVIEKFLINIPDLSEYFYMLMMICFLDGRYHQNSFLPMMGNLSYMLNTLRSLNIYGMKKIS